MLALIVCLAGCRGDDETDTPTTGEPAAPTTARLTEPQVIGALLAATEALVVADSAALGVVTAPSVYRYADVLRVDHRAIGAEIKAVADTMKVAGERSPLSERLAATAGELRTALGDTTADRSAGFVSGQIAMQRALIGAMDSMMIPSATTPALRQVLQDLRPAMVAHLQRAEQLKQILATAAAAPRPTAARISPDSARAPGDTTGTVPVPVPVRPPVRPDTVRVPPDTIPRRLEVSR